MSDKRRSINMLSGPLASRLLLFALPLALTGILQQLFNAADVAVVGQFAGKNAMAAVGSNSSVVGLMVTFFIGISMGANVVISHFTGQGNKRGIRAGVHTSIWIALVCGAAMTLLGECIARPLLTWMAVPTEVFDLSLLYLRIYLLGMPVILLYNFEAAIFRSQGDTRTPLLCLTAAGLINVGLNLFFVLVMGMSADGVALATVLSNLVSALLLLFFLIRSKEEIHLRRNDMRINKAVLREIIRIGLPAGLQSMVFSFSNVIIQSAVNSLGAAVMAASSAAFNTEILIYFLINSFGQAATTFTSQNYGAGNVQRCRRVTRTSLLLGIVFAVAAGACLLIFLRPILGLFNNDPEVISTGMIRVQIITAAQAINAIIEVMSGTMRGYGRSLGPAVIALAGICGARIGWVYTVFAHYRSFAVLIAAYPFSWIITASAICVLYLVLRKKIWLGAGKDPA